MRKIQPYIEDYEPRFEPLVIPTGSPSAPEGQDAPPVSKNGPSSTNDSSRYYSAADYRALYISGELTPTAVALAILPLIRKDTSPPGEYSAGWFDSKVDLILAAAEASTCRYKEKRSLGPLDGVPTAVKDGEHTRVSSVKSTGVQGCVLRLKTED